MVPVGPGKPGSDTVARRSAELAALGTHASCLGDCGYRRATVRTQPTPSLAVYPRLATRSGHPPIEVCGSDFGMLCPGINRPGRPKVAGRVTKSCRDRCPP